LIVRNCFAKGICGKYLGETIVEVLQVGEEFRSST
jgi:hypothetical protein